MNVVDCVRQGGKSVCFVEGIDVFGLTIGMDSSEIFEHLNPFLTQNTLIDVYLYNNEIGEFLSTLDTSHSWPDLVKYDGMMIDFEYQGREGVLRYILNEGRIQKIEWESDYVDF
ncbi:MAG: hypothetical protein CMK07_04510 [Ponticaulis sp.]|nr:hypothetical protein [Ponticaulis sp.]